MFMDLLFCHRNILVLYFMYKLFTVSDSWLFVTYLRPTFGLLVDIIMDSSIGERDWDIIILSFHVNLFYHFGPGTICDVT